jgi:hypothetical protein
MVVISTSFHDLFIQKILMEIEDGFNELAVAAHNKQSDIRHFFKTS